jgi:hypothetical protein
LLQWWGKEHREEQGRGGEEEEGDVYSDDNL